MIVPGRTSDVDRSIPEISSSCSKIVGNKAVIQWKCETDECYDEQNISTVKQNKTK
jgi:IMP cyclohydrolase